MAAANTSLHSSPSPPPTFSSSPDTSPSWHFPGPSSVFHKRAKDATRHRRVGSYTKPIAPALSTERRAQHRRVKSSATLSGGLSPSTPAASEKSRSPLSRFASYTSGTMATNAPMTPATPARALTSRPGLIMQDSPFSDYFTDDGRSSNEYDYKAPSPEAQQMLLRLNKLQSQLMRGGDSDSERETLQIVRKKLDSIDLELGSLHSQTRMPPELEDSGLFMEEEGEGNKDENVTPSGLGVEYDASHDLFEDQPTKAQRQAEHDYLLLQAQQVLKNVSKAQQRLKQCHAELRELNDTHSVDMDEKDCQIEELKSENEAMQMDLNHDHSELLFLKLQFKALEVEFDALDDDAPAKAKPAQRKKLQEEMDRWRSDWHDVDGRMKRRRTRYGVKSPQSRRDSHADAGGERPGDDDDWRLETVKKGHGRVQSIIIRRTTNDGNYFGADGADNEGEEKFENAGKISLSGISLTPKPAYSDHTTQTESVQHSWPTSEAGDDSDEHDDTPAPDEDCAITTSSEADESEYVDLNDEEKPATPVRSAWQDLWEGLSSLAGMGDERF